VGKSTLAVNIAGALAGKAPTALQDEDATMQTSAGWISPGKIQTVELLGSSDRPKSGTEYLVVDIEGRPNLSDLVDLAERATVVIPTNTNGTELEPTVALWKRLEASKANMANIRVVITKAPPTGNVGAAARDELRSLGLTVCNTVVRQYAAHARAQEQRVLVREVQDARAENAWSDILSLALELS